MPGILLAILLLGAEVPSMRCGDLLVQPGANKLDVMSRCGEPDWRERVSGPDAAAVEVWIYDWPEKNAQKLLQFNGVTLKSIRDASASSGYAGNGSLRCRGQLVQAGATMLSVRQQCGDPVLVETVSGEEETLRQVWLYDRGDATAELHFTGVQVERIVLVDR